MTRKFLPIALVLLVVPGGCGPGENDPGPGGVTIGEAEELDDAASMLESRKLPAEALDNPPAEPQGEPQPQTDQTGR